MKDNDYFQALTNDEWVMKFVIEYPKENFEMQFRPFIALMAIVHGDNFQILAYSGYT